MFSSFLCFCFICRLCGNVIYCWDVIIIINLVFSILGQAVSSRGSWGGGGGLRARIVFSWVVFQRKVFCKESYFQVQFFIRQLLFSKFFPLRTFLSNGQFSMGIFLKWSCSPLESYFHVPFFHFAGFPMRVWQLFSFDDFSMTFFTNGGFSGNSLIII